MNVGKATSTGGRSASFHSTVDYVSHDKNGRTRERVGEIMLLNLGGDIDSCAKEMQTTVDAAIAIQKRTRSREGKREKASGSKIEKPVYHFFISWHPDDKPDASHMMEKAQEALRILGLQDHQAVAVEHTDRHHKHVHVVVNLVNPNTGRMANIYRDEKKLDRWAHEYEVKHMAIWSFKRASKHEREKTKDNAPPVRNNAQPTKPEKPAPAKGWFERKPPKPTAKDRADTIKKLYAHEKGRLKQKHTERATARDQEFEDVWTVYKEKRQEVYDKYQSALDEVFKRRPKNPSLTIKPPPIQKHPVLQETPKAPASEKRRNLSNIFKQSLYRINPGNEGPLARTFRVNFEGRDIMLPIKNDPGMRRFARLNGSKKQTAHELREARRQELAELARDYDSGKSTLKKRHENERVAERKELAELRLQSAEVWTEWRKEYGITDRPGPQWVKDLRQKDKALLGRPDKEPEKPRKRVPLISFQVIRAREGNVLAEHPEGQHLSPMDIHKLYPGAAVSFGRREIRRAEEMELTDKQASTEPSQTEREASNVERSAEEQQAAPEYAELTGPSALEQEQLAITESFNTLFGTLEPGRSSFDFDTSTPAVESFDRER